MNDEEILTRYYNWVVNKEQGDYSILIEELVYLYSLIPEHINKTTLADIMDCKEDWWIE